MPRARSARRVPKRSVLKVREHRKRSRDERIASILGQMTCDLAGDGGFVLFHDVPTTAGQDDLFPNGLNFSAALVVKIYVEEGQRLCVSCPLAEDNTLTGRGSLGVSGVLEVVE